MDQATNLEFQAVNQKYQHMKKIYLIGGLASGKSTALRCHSEQGVNFIYPVCSGTLHVKEGLHRFTG